MSTPMPRPWRRSAACAVLSTLLCSPASQAQGASAPTAPRDELRPVQFAIPGGLQGVQLSPDGKRLAATAMLRSGQRVVLTQQLDGSDRRIAMVMNEPNIEVSLARWYGPQHLLLRVSAQDLEEARVGRMQLPTTRLMSATLDGKEQRLLYDAERADWMNDAAAEASAACPASPLAVFVPPDYRRNLQLLHFVAGAKGATVGADKLDEVSTYFLDTRGEPRVAYQPQEGKPAKWWLRGAGERWQPWQPPLAAGESAEPIGPDGDRLLVDVRQGDQRRLVRWPFSGAAAETLLPVLTGRVQGLLTDAQRCEVMGLQTDVGLLIWRSDVRALAAGVAQALPQARLESLQGTQYLAMRASATRPPEVLLGDRQRGTLTRIAAPYADLPETLPLTRRVHGADDFAVTVLERADAGPFSVVCLDCPIDDHFDPMAAMLAMRYGRVLIPRGLLPSDEAFHFSAVGRMAARWQAALRRDWLRDPQARLAFVGSSALAGQSALMLAAAMPFETVAVATRGALTDLEIYRRDGRSVSVPPAHVERLDKMMDGLSREERQALSPISRAGLLRMPLLLAHAQADAVVSHAHARDLAQAVRAAGGRPTLLVLERATQDLLYPPHRQQWFEGVATVIDQGLKESTR